MWHKLFALRVLLPKKFSWQKTLLGCGMVLLLGAAFCCGSWWGMNQQAKAQSPGLDLMRYTGPLVEVNHPDASTPVAYIQGQNGKIPITRQELGDYLIDRFGPERLEFLVNSKIIEFACMSKGVSVAEGEVEAQLIEDLKVMGVVKLSDFETAILKPRGKTLFEYQQDVVRPKIAMSRLFQHQVKVTEQDVKDAFEAEFGPKVKCRILVFDKEQSDRTILEIWQKVKNSEDEFKREAKKNPGPLGASGGDVPAIHQHFPDKRVEAEAFALKPGEVSSVIKMPDSEGGGSLILKCDELVPADKDHKFTDEYQRLQKEVYERKLAQEVPRAFQELRKQANPLIELKRDPPNFQAMQRVNLALARAAAERAKLVHEPAMPAGVKIAP